VTEDLASHPKQITTATKAAAETDRPVVYLDQWVWIRLAQAASGKPRVINDSKILNEVVNASESGVAFPLSSTHYIETLRTTSHRQRSDVAHTMATISHVRTLAPRHVALRAQMLTAMHEAFGRPMFRPEAPRILGVGVHWAFQGSEKRLGLFDAQGRSLPLNLFIPEDVLCRLTQWCERQFLCDPRDELIERLRNDYGFRPESTEEIIQSRLAWEETYVDSLASDPISRAELGVRIRARELVHEDLDFMIELFREYGVPFNRFRGGPRVERGAQRALMIAFADSMPSIRIAVDRKVELFRNSSNARIPLK
jgi:hypothetical protein